jgi:hypothetical protein
MSAARPEAPRPPDAAIVATRPLNRYVDRGEQMTQGSVRNSVVWRLEGCSDLFAVDPDHASALQTPDYDDCKRFTRGQRVRCTQRRFCQRVNIGFPLFPSEQTESKIWHRKVKISCID